MRSFTDTTGRSWNLTVTVLTVKRVREATDVLLTALFDDKCTLLAELSGDLIKLVDVLWVVCEGQAKEAGITPEQFAEGLGGDSLGQAGEALVRATADFFTSPEQRRALHKLLDTMTETARQFTEKTAAMVDELDPSQLAENCLDFVTSGQAKPASTPIPEPLANSA